MTVYSHRLKEKRGRLDSRMTPFPSRPVPLDKLLPLLVISMDCPIARKQPESACRRLFKENLGIKMNPTVIGFIAIFFIRLPDREVHQQHLTASCLFNSFRHRTGDNKPLTVKYPSHRDR